MGRVSEASVAHPYQNIGEVTPLPVRMETIRHDISS